ncbi:MAG TPA: hypothetical protein VHQ01_04705, partial [Pyrinomonadaceae bacterium]|nr:hypothetical protein [Pyrinomonadaceae bacterium]
VSIRPMSTGVNATARTNASTTRIFVLAALCAQNGAKVTMPPTRAKTTRKTKNGRNGISKGSKVFFGLGRYLMNGVRSPKIEAVNVVKILSTQGKVIKKITNMATIRGAKEKVWSCIDVRVWIKLIMTPTTMATTSIGATIHISVVRAPCIRDVTNASSIIATARS